MSIIYIGSYDAVQNTIQPCYYTMHYNKLVEYLATYLLIEKK